MLKVQQWKTTTYLPIYFDKYYVLDENERNKNTYFDIGILWIFRLSLRSSPFEDDATLYLFNKLYISIGGATNVNDKK